MSELRGKIDFLLLVTAENANPNGDPLNGNRPREDFEGRGEISDVCIKRKIRNRWQDMGKKIFVQSDERSDDGFRSLKARADGCEELQAEIKKGRKRTVICARRLPAGNGWMCAVLDRYLRSRERKFLWVSGVRFLSIRLSAYLR